MTTTAFPQTTEALTAWQWDDIQPHLQALQEQQLTAENVEAWLADWTAVHDHISELHSRLYVATTLDTADEVAEQRYHAFLDDILPKATAADNDLTRKFLDSGLEVEEFEIPRRNMATQVALFREENLPLLTEEQKLASVYNRLSGTITVEWEGEEKTLPQMALYLKSPDRETREKAWRLEMEGWLAQRDAINENWGKLMEIRRQQAQNAGFDDYRSYCWQRLLRFDYTPDDCKEFHAAIEEVVVPVVKQRREKRRHQMSLESLRPWDLDSDTQGRKPLHPFETVDELESRVETMFGQVDPELQAYFTRMRNENLLDLDSRKGKRTGGYCTSFDVTQQPFIFMNAAGTHLNVRTLLHEAGHSFHVFETTDIPYFQQQRVPMEFAEVASQAMELLASRYLGQEYGGFYDDGEAARARIEHLEMILGFWPYMAVVDAFQHWVYENHAAASDPAACDAQWGELWERFMPGVDWSELEEERVTGWHRKGHIHRRPFYYVEYGLAWLGAVQIWKNATENQPAALQAYRNALSLGGRVGLPELYAAAGGRFAFDHNTLAEAVGLIQATLDELEG